jgi:hypothetical protein
VLVCARSVFDAGRETGGHAGGVPSELEFRDLGEGGIIAVVDGIDLTTFPADGGLEGLSPDEARVVARMLQGWEPPPLEDDSEELAETAKPVEGAPGFYSIDAPRVRFRLPGGDEPEVDSRDLDEFRDLEGVPIAGCSCGGGVGCATLYVEVAYAVRGDDVTWTVEDRRFVFPREHYRRAIRQLLERVNETPRLIDE